MQNIEIQQAGTRIVLAEHSQSIGCALEALKRFDWPEKCGLHCGCMFGLCLTQERI